MNEREQIVEALEGAKRALEVSTAQVAAVVKAPHSVDCAPTLTMLAKACRLFEAEARRLRREIEAGG